MIYSSGLIDKVGLRQRLDPVLLSIQHTDVLKLPPTDQYLTVTLSPRRLKRLERRS